MPNWDAAPYIQNPDQLAAAPAGEIWLPCKSCSDGWSQGYKVMPKTMGTRGRSGVSYMLIGGDRPCKACQTRLERADPHRYAQAVKDDPGERLYRDAQGRWFYKMTETKIPAWKKARIPKEYAGLSLAPKPGKERNKVWNFSQEIKVVDRTKDPGGLKIAERKPGITYVEIPKALEAVMALRSVVEGSTTCVMLHGFVGTGKTHLMCAAGQDLAQAGKSVIMVEEPLLHERFYRAIKDEEQAAILNGMLASYEECDVLLWDELADCKAGATALPDFIAQRLSALFRTRRRTGKVTIWTANATWQGLEDRLGEAFVSRIRGDCGMNTFWLKGRDWRYDLADDEAEGRRPEATERK